jgi:ribonuclease Y
VRHHGLQELGLDEKMAKRRPVARPGQAVDHEVEGPHAVIGADLAKKHGEVQEIIHAIQAHHEDAPQTAIATLVQAAGLSACPALTPARARNFAGELMSLPGGAGGTPPASAGVSKAYAIQ